MIADSEAPQGWVIHVFVFGVILAAVVYAWIMQWVRKRRFASMTVVKEGVEYPNNHHVFGVGYYHATDRRWNILPWNEYREGQGFFWDGVWRKEPDQRKVAKSTPEPVEIARVNEAWRNADPDKMSAFWSKVDRFGFGSMLERSERS